MLHFKKLAAGAAAMAMAASLAGCGESSSYAFTMDGEKVPAGVYIYYSYLAYNEALETLSEQNSELDTTDNKLVKEQIIDNVDTLTWIQNKAQEYCAEQIVVNKKYEEAGLSLSEEQLAEIDSALANFSASNAEVFAKNGISEASVRQVMEYSYKASDLFLYYYDIDGKEGKTEDEVHAHYVDNHARVQYIRFNLVDGNGEELDDAGKQDMKKMAEGYLADVKKLSNEDAIHSEMNAIQEEYSAYVTSVSEEAAALTATSATDEDGNEIPATTTVTTTTTEETTTTTVAAAEDEEAAVTAGENADETDETVTTTTVAEEAEDEEAETTTTTSPYANESIIVKATTDEDTKEDEITYSPTKKVHDYVFDADTKNLKAELIEDEEANAYFLIVKFDIEKRMTEDDLWTSDAKTSEVSSMFSPAFRDQLKVWEKELDVQVNNSAIKRYDPFAIDFTSDQQAQQAQY